MKIWQKNIFSKLTRTYCFLLLCLIVIYVIIDLSAHGVRFLNKSSIAEIALYYFNTFVMLLDLFLSLTFLLATIRVLYQLNSHRELVALQMAGISKKKLLLPFFIFASCLSLISYLNTEWLSPAAQNSSTAFKTALKSKKHKNKENRVFTIPLKDKSEIVYQKFDKIKQELFDVFWIRSPDDIWHMKTLKIDTLQGKYVNHLSRNIAKQLEKIESYPEKDFSDLALDRNSVLYRFVPYENRPLSALFLEAFADPTEKRIIFSYLFYKLLIPLMPFLVLFAIAPVSMRYSRTSHIFLVAAYSIFGFISLKVILDGMLILGENQVLPSYVAIFGPILFVLSVSLPNFARMR
jgi:lipopolysaccharide export LptBFGC system permease protein LptF